MKIYALSSYTHNNRITFRASNPYLHNDNSSEQNKNENKPLPEWARKAMLFTLLFFAFKNSPTVQNLVNPYEPTQEDLDRTEFFEKSRKMIKGSRQKSSAFYQLNQLIEMEQPKIKSLGNNSYELEFELDKQKVSLQMKLDENSKDTIRGRVKLDDRDFVTYKAVFSPDNKDEFKMLIKDKNERKYVFGRNYMGEFYQVRNNKRVILNNKNIKRYEEYQEMLNDLDKFSFFTDSNPFWRKANYLLLMLLVYLEMQHDKARARARQKENENNKEV